MKKTIKSHLLLLTFLSTSIYGGEVSRVPFISHINLSSFISGLSFDNCRSFIENNRFVAFCLLTGAGIGSYFSYKCFGTKKIPVQPSPEQQKPEIIQSIAPNIKWVQTTDNQLVAIDLDKDLLKCSLRYGLENCVENHSQENPVALSCSHEELHLIINATHALQNDALLLHFTEQDLQKLDAIATRWNIQYISQSNAIQKTRDCVSLMNTMTDMVPARIATTLSPRFFLDKTEVSLFRNIMSIVIQPEEKPLVRKKNIYETHDPHHYNKHFDTASHHIVLKYDRQENKYGTYSTKIYDKKTQKLLKTFDNGINCSTYNPYADTLILLPHTNSVIFHETDSTWTAKAKSLFSMQNQGTQAYATASRWVLYNIDTDEKINLPIDQKKYLSVSPDGKLLLYRKKNTIFLLNISNPYNIRTKKLHHPNISSFAFNHDSTQLVSASAATIELWNLADVDWDVQESIIQLISTCHFTESINYGVHVKFLDEKHIKATEIISSRTCDATSYKVFIINTNDFQNIKKIYDCSSERLSKIHHSIDESSHLVTDLFCYTEPMQDLDSDKRINIFKLVSCEGTELYSQSTEEYDTFRYNSLPDSDGTNKYFEPCRRMDLLVSEDRKFCATAYPFSLLELQENNQYQCIKGPDIHGRCIKLNNDGSYCLQDSYAIKFYNNQHQNLMTIGDPQYTFSRVEFKDNEVMCTHYNPLHEKGENLKHSCTLHWPLPSEKEQNQLFEITKNFTPQQMLCIDTIYKIGAASHDKKEKIIIKKNTFLSKTFESFAADTQRPLKEKLRLQIQ